MEMKLLSCQVLNKHSKKWRIRRRCSIHERLYHRINLTLMKLQSNCYAVKLSKSLMQFQLLRAKSQGIRTSSIILKSRRTPWARLTQTVHSRSYRVRLRTYGFSSRARLCIPAGITTQFVMDPRTKAWRICVIRIKFLWTRANYSVVERIVIETRRLRIFQHLQLQTFLQVALQIVDRSYCQAIAPSTARPIGHNVSKSRLRWARRSCSASNCTRRPTQHGGVSALTSLATLTKIQIKSTLWRRMRHNSKSALEQEVSVASAIISWHSKTSSRNRTPALKFLQQLLDEPLMHRVHTRL